MKGLVLVFSMCVLGCGGNSSLSTMPPTPRHYLVSTATESFVVELVTQRQFTDANRSMAGESLVINGRPESGNGGYNRNGEKGEWWGWHLAPESIVFTGAAAEGCDGRPRAVETDLAYWILLGHYCPWDARIVRRID